MVSFDPKGHHDRESGDPGPVAPGGSAGLQDKEVASLFQQAADALAGR
jgi:hypothetical protein